MKKNYINFILFWFVLLILAFLNAGIRELTYKPLLTPYIGIWAHQISSLTGILLFFIAIYLFLKYSKREYSNKDLYMIGIILFLMTFIFEVGMNLFVRQLSWIQILQTYYFWKGETWIFVLIFLIFSPRLANKIMR